MVLLDKPTSPSGRKEVLISEREKVPIVERKLPKEIEPEVKDWLTKLETGEEIQLPQPVTDDQGQVIVDTPAPQKVTVTLPLTEEEIRRGLGLKVVDSLLWLAEWTKRLLKIVGGKFIYKLKV
ncbi:MAG TPA: hypothetical protein VMX76_00145 [Nevskiaceae bacterium]|nr:hypothetical protein [Nevskiaceae bacterium]